MNLKKQRNLAMAKNAVNYTMKKMTIGAANKNKDLFSSLGFSLFCVAGIRKTKESGSGLAYLRAIASESEKAGCGNCAEQSAIAFIYLYDRAVRPLDYMIRQGVDHAFIVIGREEGSDINDYNTWGVNAIVCDPWAEKSYSVNEIPHNMYGGGKLTPRVYLRIK